MNYENRRRIMEELARLRKRALLCFLNFDRECTEGGSGLSTHFHADTKEVLYRLLRDLDTSRGVDLYLYTRGGDINSVWPIVSLVREYDPGFEVLVPFRCHSSGTLLALGARRIVMSRLAELSPIDPSTTNRFNPTEESDQEDRKPISVEDVAAFLELAKENGLPESTDFMAMLAGSVHPLALGNVHRVYRQGRQLAKTLLLTSGAKPRTDARLEDIVEKMSSGFYSHLHAIPRAEARETLGDDQVRFANEEEEAMLDGLLRVYEDSFALRRKFIPPAALADEKELSVDNTGGVIETVQRSYLFRTQGVWAKDLRNEIEFRKKSQDWSKNPDGR